MQDDRYPYRGRSSRSGYTPSDKFNPADLVLYLAQHVVDQSSAVQVSQKAHTILVQVAAGEEGRLIGRQGRVIQAIRTVVRSVTDGRERLNIDLESSRTKPSP